MTKSIFDRWRVKNILNNLLFTSLPEYIADLTRVKYILENPPCPSDYDRSHFVKGQQVGILGYSPAVGIPIVRLRNIPIDSRCHRREEENAALPSFRSGVLKSLSVHIG
jgi:hypothetical protein